MVRVRSTGYATKPVLAIACSTTTAGVVGALRLLSPRGGASAGGAGVGVGVRRETTRLGNKPLDWKWLLADVNAILTSVWVVWLPRLGICNRVVSKGVGVIRTSWTRDRVHLNSTLHVVGLDGLDGLVPDVEQKDDNKKADEDQSNQDAKHDDDSAAATARAGRGVGRRHNWKPVQRCQWWKR